MNYLAYCINELCVELSSQCKQDEYYTFGKHLQIYCSRGLICIILSFHIGFLTQHCHYFQLHIVPDDFFIYRFFFYIFAHAKHTKTIGILCELKNQNLTFPSILLFIPQREGRDPMYPSLLYQCFVLTFGKTILKALAV